MVCNHNRVCKNDDNHSTIREEKLTAAQRRLVSNNLGLIGVHIKRHVCGLRFPHFDREWDDLFQEGCLGLIDAAKRYSQSRNMTFATFALPRIRNAVNKALNYRFNTIYIPHKKLLTQPQAIVFQTPIPEKTTMNSEEALATLTTSPPVFTTAQTIGDRIRQRYESAVHKATDWMMRLKTSRDDRRRLIDTIIEHRLLIPNEENKTPLRQIARETNSSYSRVSQCEKQMIKKIHDILAEDFEFVAMDRYARKKRLGMDHPVDEALDCNLRQASSDEMLRRYRKANPQGQASLMWRVMETDTKQAERMLRDRFTQLEPGARRAIIEDNLALSSIKSVKNNKYSCPKPSLKTNQFTPSSRHDIS